MREVIEDLVIEIHVTIPIASPSYLISDADLVSGLEDVTGKEIERALIFPGDAESWEPRSNVTGTRAIESESVSIAASLVDGSEVRDSERFAIYEIVVN